MYREKKKIAKVFRIFTEREDVRIWRASLVSLAG